MKPLDLAGQRFGRWLVVKRVEAVGNSRWLCQCDCGTRKSVVGSFLKNGVSKSCGCFRAEVTAERMRMLSGHNASETKTYSSWRKMMGRCFDPADIGYHRYGGRGIGVHARWTDFRNFLSDMGERPDGFTLDRINPNGDYEPANCKWATRAEQSGNRRNTMWVEVNGERMNLKEASRRLGVDYDHMRYEYKKLQREQS
jgi:hypothetical protein